MKQEFTYIVGSDQVVDDPEILDAYAHDWSAAPPLQPLLLLKPATQEQLSRCLALCHRNRQPVVIQGGRTGLSGAATPQDREIAISLEKMSEIVSIDTAAMTMHVQAGATLQEVQEAAAAVDLQFPLDLGSRGSCTIGGNAATNAGGNRVVRYGMMRDLVLGIEAVLPTGEIVGGMNQMLKNNAGYDLKHLFIGSEGTLGVITDLVLRLHPIVKSEAIALCAAQDLASLIALLQLLKRNSGGRLSAFEVMWADYFEPACAAAKIETAWFEKPYPVYALVELQASDDCDTGDLLEALLGEALERSLIEDVIVAQSGRQTAQIWSVREAIGDMLAGLKPSIACDISLPLAKMDEFVAAVRSALADEYPEAKVMTFGHLGDGNLHINIHHNDIAVCHKIEDMVLSLAGKSHASITGEHGVGVIKKPYLGYSRSRAEIELMLTLKAALDPNEILNRGRVFASTIDQI